MWLASGSNRYGACASLLELSYHSGMTAQIRQYLKVVAARGFAANSRVGGNRRVLQISTPTLDPGCTGPATESELRARRCRTRLE